MIFYLRNTDNMDIPIFIPKYIVLCIIDAILILPEEWSHIHVRTYYNIIIFVQGDGQHKHTKTTESLERNKNHLR